MKKIFLPFILTWVFPYFFQPANAQCPYDNSLVATGDAPQVLNDQVYATGVWGGEMVRITNVKGGNTYAISTCENIFYFDSELTIYPGGGGSPLAYDDDGCGVYTGPSYMEFTPAQDGFYDILLDEWQCQDNAIGMDIYITLIAEGTGGGEAGCGTPATPASLVIPVVVHVLYNTPDQNISDEQIKSQIDVLNCDYRRVNGDFNTVVPAVYQGIGADMSIQFLPGQCGSEWKSYHGHNPHVYHCAGICDR
jgi:hypothetical protein